MVPFHTLKPIDPGKDAPHRTAHRRTPLSSPNLLMMPHRTRPHPARRLFRAAVATKLFFLAVHKTATKRSSGCPAALRQRSDASPGCHEPAALHLSSPSTPALPPSGHCKPARKHTEKPRKRNLTHHICSTDDFIPITCSCHAKKRATGQNLNPEPDNTTAKNEDTAPSIYFRFLHAGISPSEPEESLRSALGGKTDIKAQLYI